MAKQKKKPAPKKKPCKDVSQRALSIVEHIIGGKLSDRPTGRKRK
jgi:hypothetical protein